MGEGGDRSGGGFRDWARLWAGLAAAQGDAAAALAPDPAEAAEDALWRAAEAQLDLWRRSAGFLAAGARSAPAAEALARLLDPAAWAFGPALLDPALRRLVDGPSPAELAQLGRETLPQTREWRALARARVAHRRLVLAAWRRCFAAVAGEGLAAGGETGPETDPDAFAERWIVRAGAELEALQARPDFLASQRRLVAAATALRAREEALVAAWCEANGLPTRGEVDALHDALAALRREVRTLKREIGRAS